MRGAKKEAAAEVGKSVCIAAIVTLAAVLVFALLVKLFTIGSGAITAVNQVIKAVAIFVGCMVCVKPGRGLLKGLVSGVAVIILTYFLFAILAGEITFGWTNVLDLVFGALVGAVSGFVAGFVKNK